MRTHYSLSSACYLEADNKVLFLKFNKKWGKIYTPPGGKVEEGETPLECAIREFKEETGLTLINPILKGYFHWNWINQKYGVIFVYTAKEYNGELKESDEGTLHWIEKKEVPKLKQFEMNSKFSDLLFKDVMFEGNFLLNEDDTVKEYNIIKFEI